MGFEIPIQWLSLLLFGSLGLLLMLVGWRGKWSLWQRIRAVTTVDRQQRRWLAVVVFVGNVRQDNEGRDVDYLEYEAYPGMAEAKMAQIGDEIRHHQDEAPRTRGHRPNHRLPDRSPKDAWGRSEQKPTALGSEATAIRRRVSGCHDNA